MLDQNQLNKLLDYDSNTGRILWAATRPGRGCRKGNEAGTINRRKDTSYKAVCINGKKHYVHRIIWIMVNGPIPNGMCIDHIDGNGLNNKISNLRLASLSENHRNSKISSNNKTGILGVNSHAKGFVVQAAGEYIGYFMDFFEACCARKSAEIRLGFHENHGVRS